MPGGRGSPGCFRGSPGWPARLPAGAGDSEPARHPGAGDSRTPEHGIVIPPSLPAPAPWDARVPGTRRAGTRKRPPLSAQDAHVPGARDPGTRKRPPRDALDTLIPVHGDPAQSNGLSAVHRTPISLVHGNPVHGDGLFPSAHLSASPAVPPVPCPPQWRGGNAARRRGALLWPPPRPGGEGRSGPGNCPANADWPPPRSPGRPLAAPGGRGPAPARASREAKFQETWLRARSPAGAGRECRGAGAGARVWGSRGSRDQGFREQGVTGIWGS